MRLALSSRSFARRLESGDLTQLEWIDICCAQSGLGGVDLSHEHFPRRDAEYLAQIKKLCVDRQLTIAGLNTSIALGDSDVDPQIDALKQTLDDAAALGAPLLRFGCGAGSGSPAIAWRELIRALKYVSGHAKLRNVTLALAPREGSLVANDADVKRAVKECDSAWLRLAIPAAVEWEPYSRDAVIMTMQPSGYDVAATLRFRGFVSLEDESGELDEARLSRWAEALR
jgi:sugar phosphate isomerase/epimerase